MEILFFFQWENRNFKVLIYLLGKRLLKMNAKQIRSYFTEIRQIFFGKRKFIDKIANEFQIKTQKDWKQITIKKIEEIYGFTTNRNIFYFPVDIY